MAVGCLLFPGLEVRLALRTRPDLVGRAVVLIDGAGDGAMVSAATVEARAAGVMTGISAGQAHTACPNGVFLRERAGDCLDELERLSAIIGLRAPGPVIPGGRDRLFLQLPGDGLAALQNVARMWSGQECWAGAGPGRADALEAARCGRGRPVIVHGVGPTEQIAERTSPVTATVNLATSGGELALRAAVRATLKRMQALLAGREESFREVRVVTRKGAVMTEAKYQSHRPLHTAEEALALAENGLRELGDRPADSLVVSLGRLGPDMRVRPCSSAPARTMAGSRGLRAAS